MITAGAIAAAYWSVRLSYADALFRQNTPQSLARAIRLVPGKAEYLARWADLAVEAGVPVGPVLEALRRAVALNPYDSALWMQLGLRAELAGDLATAEKALREAARVDRTHEPRATLAHYYYRRNDAPNFWRWVREALETAYTDAGPLFRTCWEMTSEAQLILERAIPRRPEIRAQYLSFLLSTRRLEAAVPVAEELAAQARAEDVPVLLSFCDHLLEARVVEPALRVWNALALRKAIPYQPLDPERGSLVVNGDFAQAPQPHGFDWRLHPPEGVSIAQDHNPRSLRLSFSGKQPESCELMYQWVPLRPAASYRLRFRYRTAGINPGAGPRWRVFDAAGGARQLCQSEPLAAEDWSEGELVFATPQATQLGRVVLAYQRELGTTRITGSLWLAGVELVPAP